MNVQFSRFRRALLRAIPTLDPYHRPRLPFPRDSSVRRSSYPFISGDTFRAMCKHVFDETDVEFDPRAVAHGDCVFVNGSMLHEFLTYAHPVIAHPYILITHNSDRSMPGRFASYLETPSIGAWFTQNPDRMHPKLHAIPIGLANAHWRHGDTEAIQRLMPDSIPATHGHQHLAYLNFKRRRLDISRNELWSLLEQSGFCHVAVQRSYAEYLLDMRAARFTISPPGNGLDCHRHWEALLVGSVPIMRHSTIDPLFEGLPVVLVSDWREVTREMLAAKDQELRGHTFDPKRLFAQYWFDRIAQVRSAVLWTPLPQN